MLLFLKKSSTFMKKSLDQIRKDMWDMYHSSPLYLTTKIKFNTMVIKILERDKFNNNQLKKKAANP